MCSGCLAASHFWLFYINDFHFRTLTQRWPWGLINQARQFCCFTWTCCIFFRDKQYQTIKILWPDRVVIRPEFESNTVSVVVFFYSSVKFLLIPALHVNLALRFVLFPPLSVHLLSGPWVLQLADRGEIPAVRLTDTVSPQSSHVGKRQGASVHVGVGAQRK